MLGLGSERYGLPTLNKSLGLRVEANGPGAACDLALSFPF